MCKWRYRLLPNVACAGLVCLSLTACGSLPGTSSHGVANGRVAASAEPLSTEQSTVEQITVEALASRIEQGTAPLILDVRSPEEYAEGHIPGAVNIHFRQVPNQLDTIRELAEEGEIIVYCERGVRAGIAERSLLKADFSPVIQLTGHMPAWRTAGFSIVTGE